MPVVSGCACRVFGAEISSLLADARRFRRHLLWDIGQFVTEVSARHESMLLRKDSVRTNQSRSSTLG